MTKTMENKKERDVPAYRKHFKQTRSDELYVRILDHMLKNRLYRNSKYMARQLADDLGVKPRHISAAIANQTGGNYNAFVNGFRLRDACRMLASPRHASMTIEEVGLLSGFTSRQAFYVAFAREYNVTPKEYRLEKLPPARKEEPSDDDNP